MRIDTQLSAPPAVAAPIGTLVLDATGDVVYVNKDGTAGGWDGLNDGVFEGDVSIVGFLNVGSPSIPADAPGEAAFAGDVLIDGNVVIAGGFDWNATGGALTITAVGTNVPLRVVSAVDRPITVVSTDAVSLITFVDSGTTGDGYVGVGAQGDILLLRSNNATRATLDTNGRFAVSGDGINAGYKIGSDTFLYRDGVQVLRTRHAFTVDGVSTLTGDVTVGADLTLTFGDGIIAAGTLAVGIATAPSGEFVAHFVGNSGADRTVKVENIGAGRSVVEIVNDGSGTGQSAIRLGDAISGDRWTVFYQANNDDFFITDSSSGNAVLRIYNGATNTFELGGVVQCDVDILTGSLGVGVAAPGVSGSVKFVGATGNFLDWNATNGALILSATSGSTAINFHLITTGDFPLLLESLDPVAIMGFRDSLSTGDFYVGIGAQGDDLKLRAGDAMRATLTAAGRFTLPVQGSAGGIKIGNEISMYRVSSDVLALIGSEWITVALGVGVAPASTIGSARFNRHVTIGGAINLGTRLNVEPGAAALDLATSVGIGLNIEADTWSINAAGDSETKAVGALVYFGTPTWSSVGLTFTVTKAATLYIAGPPVASTNVTLDSSVAIHVANGDLELAAGNFIGVGATFSGDFAHTGAKYGFYSTTPIIKQTGVASTVDAIHGALVNLGLIAA